MANRCHRSPFLSRLEPAGQGTSITHTPEDLGLSTDRDLAAACVSGAATRSNIVDAEWAGTDWTLARAMRTVMERDAA